MTKATTLVLVVVWACWSTQAHNQCPPQCTCIKVESSTSEPSGRGQKSSGQPTTERNVTENFHLDCSTSSATEVVPTKLPSHTRSIRWTDTSNVNKRFEGFFNDSSWKEVQDVTLRFNTDTIRVHSFEGIKDVVNISIHSETLHAIENASFQTLSYLERLDLSYCSNLSFQTLSSAAKSLSRCFKVFRGDNMGVKLAPWTLDDNFLSGFNGTNMTEFHIPFTNLRLFTANPKWVPNLAVVNVSGNNFVSEAGFLFAFNLRVIDVSHVTFPANWFLHDSETSSGPRKPIITENLAFSDLMVPNLSVIYLTGAMFGESPIVIENGYANIGLSKLKTIYSGQLGIKVLDLQIRGPDALLEVDLSKNDMERITSAFFSNLNRLERIDLSYNKLFVIESTEDFKQLFASNDLLRFIDLSYNQLTTLPSDMFLNNTFLEYLLLKGNTIHTIDFQISHIHSLRMIDLSNNRLNTVGDLLAENITSLSQWNKANNKTSVQLRLADNPLKCPQCEDASQSFYKIEEHIVDRDKVTCVKSDDSETVRYPEKVKCQPEPIPPTVVIVSVVICVVLTVSLTISGFMFYRYKQRKLLFKELREERGPPDYIAFVSYCSSDADFVLESFVPQLEPRLRDQTGIQNRDFLLIDDRHFTMGEHITNNVINAVRVSCVSVFMISESYIKSKWCDFESKVVDLEGKPVVLVFLEKVCVKKSKWIKKLMNRWPYIQWPGMMADKEEQREQFYSKLANDLVKYWNNCQNDNNVPLEAMEIQP